MSAYRAALMLDFLSMGPKERLVVERSYRSPCKPGAAPKRLEHATLARAHVVSTASQCCFWGYRSPTPEAVQLATSKSSWMPCLTVLNRCQFYS